MSLPDVTLGGSTRRTTEPDRSDFDDTSVLPVEELPGTDLEVAETGDLPDSDLGGSRMSGAEWAWVVALHVRREVAAQFRFVFSHADGVRAMRSETWAEYNAYRKGRSWLPEGHRGGALEMVPAVYYATVGKLGFVFDGAAEGLRGCGWVFKRMLRLVVALLLLLTIVGFWFFN